MEDVLLVKELNKEQFNSKKIIPVTFTTDSNDRCRLVGFFNELKDKDLVESNKIYIKNSSITIDIISSNITRVTKELIEKDFMIYGIYVLYNNYLGGDYNE